MNWSLQHFENNNYLKVICTGLFSVEAQRSMIGEIVSNERWHPGTALFFDNRTLDFGRTDFSIITAASESFSFYRAQLGGGKIAVLMKSTADFGRGRQFQLVSESRISNRISVFLDEKEALDWLLA